MDVDGQRLKGAGFRVHVDRGTYVDADKQTCGQGFGARCVEARLERPVHGDIEGLASLRVAAKDAHHAGVHERVGAEGVGESWRELRGGVRTACEPRVLAGWRDAHQRSGTFAVDDDVAPHAGGGLVGSHPHPVKFALEVVA